MHRVDNLLRACTTGSRGTLRVVFRFAGSGDLQGAEVTTTGLDEDDRGCVQQAANLARLRPFRARSHRLVRSLDFRPARLEEAVTTGIAACDEWPRVACACQLDSMRDRLCTMAVESNASLAQLRPHLRPHGVTAEEDRCRMMVRTMGPICGVSTTVQTTTASGPPPTPTGTPAPPPTPAPPAVSPATQAQTAAAKRSIFEHVIRAVLDDVTADVMDCAGGRWGTVRVWVAVDPAGQIVEAHVRSAPFAGTPEGACMEAAVRRRRAPAVPASLGPRLEVERSFSWTPTAGQPAPHDPRERLRARERAASRAISEAMRRCDPGRPGSRSADGAGGPPLSGTIRVDFDDRGRISGVAVVRGSLMGTSAARCLERTLPRARIPRYPVERLTTRSVWFYPRFPVRPPAQVARDVPACDRYTSLACSCSNEDMQAVSCESAPIIVRAWRARATQEQRAASCSQMVRALEQGCGR
jgi:hypothetical protein